MPSPAAYPVPSVREQPGLPVLPLVTALPLERTVVPVSAVPLPEPVEPQKLVLFETVPEACSGQFRPLVPPVLRVLQFFLVLSCSGS
jgi:hypothetical protein